MTGPSPIVQKDGISEINSFEVLEKIYSGLYFAFVEKCRVTRNYLRVFENDPYMLLAEYTTRWNSYVASIIEIESSLESLPKQINELHKYNFPHHPQNPEFSFWRLMVSRFVSRKCETYRANRQSYGFVRFFRASL